MPEERKAAQGSFKNILSRYCDPRMLETLFRDFFLGDQLLYNRNLDSFGFIAMYTDCILKMTRHFSHGKRLLL